MECWHCERPAHAVCKFCGRAVCKAHVREMPYIIHSYHNSDGEFKAIVVSGSIYCGICKPEQEPISLKNMT